MTCEHCAHDVPDGVFCTLCGAHQGTTQQVGDPKRRLRHFAAHPGEHVLHPGVFTTLFPHLGQQKVHEFRWAFIAGVVAIFILYFTGLITAALLAAAFFVPVLYLIYLYEAQVYRDAPAPVLGFTIGGGIILGIIVTLITDGFTNPLTLGITGVYDAGALVLLAIVVPIIQEIVKPIPALLLRGRPAFRETVDGLVFGVAAGLGFSIAETLVRFSRVLGNLPLHTNPGNWIYSLLTLSVLLPLLQGSATGAITAALWRMGRGRAGGREIGAIVLAFAAHIAFVLASQLLQTNAWTPLLVLFWQAMVVGALLIYIRYMLHHALLEESAHLGFAETICPNCHRHIMAAGFCPNCGKALTAAPASVTTTRTPVATPSNSTPATAAATTTEGM